MKTLKYFSVIIFAAMLAACDDFLDQNPYSEITDDNYFSNDAEILGGLVGCYSKLQTIMGYEWKVTELRSDNTRVATSSSTSEATKQLVQMDQNRCQTTNTLISDYWEACYNGIYRCNNVLLYTPNITDPSVGRQIEGELRFIRSMLYFNLVRLWGPIFLMDTPISSVDARYKQRSSADQVYEFIINDLKTVIDNNMIPSRSEQKSSEVGRVVMEAAKVLLAKVYITYYQPGDAEYAKAGLLLEEVIVSLGNPQSGSDLEPYDKIFSTQNKMNKVIIFAVRYKSGKLGLGNTFGNDFAPDGSGAYVVIGEGNSYNYVTTNITSQFNLESDDLRIAPSYAEGYYKGTDWISEASAKGKARYIKKFLDPGQIDKNDGGCDWPVIRMGDVLLLYAEIENELQNVTPALKYLNIVRNRAGLAPVIETAVYDVRQAIRNERRKELAFENHRLFDLLRWGIAVETINAFVTAEGLYETGAYTFTPIEEWNLLLPLPQSVMNINPELSQNYGY